MTALSRVCSRAIVQPSLGSSNTHPKKGVSTSLSSCSTQKFQSISDTFSKVPSNERGYCTATLMPPLSSSDATAKLREAVKVHRFRPNYEECKRLVDQGADPEEPDNTGKSVYDTVSEYRQIELMELFNPSRLNFILLFRPRISAANSSNVYQALLHDVLQQNRLS